MDVRKDVHSDERLRGRVHDLEEDMEILQHNFDVLLQTQTCLNTSINKLKEGILGTEPDAVEELLASLVTIDTQRPGTKIDSTITTTVNGVKGIRPTSTIPLSAEKSEVVATAHGYVPAHMRNSPQTNAGNSVKTECQNGDRVNPKTHHYTTDESCNDNPTAQVVSAQEIDLSVKINAAVSDKTNMPYYISNLAALPASVKAIIPTDDMITFHPHLIEKAFGGVLWSPGMYYIMGRDPCIVESRSYYMFDPVTEPFLPKTPGEHGAKLTAFFNESPRDTHGDPDTDADPYENVPMFVLVKDRYVYFGDYSQTRWSDKLDYDSMKTKVPKHVKHYWATELTAEGRPEWVTQQLKQHFFPMPVYGGYLSTTSSEGTTVGTEEEEKKTTKDVERYINMLRSCARDANMKTSLLSAQTILNSFELTDTDNPPALRLWWEYLECVSWNKNLYDHLVELQTRGSSGHFDER